MSVVQRLREKGLTADKVDEYKAAFDLFDTDRSGRLTADKLGAVLNDKFGQGFSYDDLSYMLRQFDESGEVTFEAFALSLHQKMGDPRFGDAFGDAFDLFDVDKRGELSKGDLIDGMLKLGETLTDTEAEEMLKITKKKDDFVKSMTSAVQATAASGGGAASGGAPAAAAPAAAAPGGGPARPGGPPGGPAGGPPRPAGGPPGGPPRPAGGPPGGPPRPAGGPPGGPPRPGGPPGGPPAGPGGPPRGPPSGPPRGPPSGPPRPGA